MVRADRIALAAAGLLTKAALGLLGLAFLIGWDAPPPRTAAVPGRPDDPAAMTVALRVPEGEPARHLTVVDESGREMATLTLWASGMRTVVSRSGAIVVGMYLGADGSARTHLATTAGITVVEARPGGTSRVSVRDAATGLEPGRGDGGFHPPNKTATRCEP